MYVFGGPMYRVLSWLCMNYVVLFVTSGHKLARIQIVHFRGS